jgi:hypothetical protein
MEAPRVYLVHLRRPNSNPNEMRSDPFWEYGSFGCTGCPSKNLLSPKNAPALEGARLGFAQGGRSGFRLVFLTPPVNVKQFGKRFEIAWSPTAMPFKYEAAPLLVANDGRSDVPLMMAMVTKTLRTTLEGGFSSCFRSRALPLNEALADQVVAAYERTRSSAAESDISACYSEALPHPPPLVDRNRSETYQRLVAKMKADGENPLLMEIARHGRCG